MSQRFTRRAAPRASRFTARAAIGTVASLSLLLTACAGGGAEAQNEVSLSTEEMIANLGGQENHDRFMALYDEAVEAGQTTVMIYGPEAVGMSESIQSTWAAYFPEITLEAVQTNGAPVAERVTAEATTGTGFGDIVIGGAPDLITIQDQLAEFDPFTGDEIGEEHRGPKGMITSALMPFAFAYNTNNVSGDEIPSTWSDLLEPEWEGRLSMPDPTTPNAAFLTLNTLLYNGTWTVDDLEQLKANDPTTVSGTIINGPLTNVAQGQSDASFPTTITTIEGAMNDGTQVDMVFPMAEDSVVITEYMGVLETSPSPLAGELYANWRLTVAGADAVAGYG